MSTYPNARRDYAGPPNGKPGKPRLDFPTQSLDDQSIIEDAPFRVDDPTFQLTPYLTPHPKAPAYILVNQFPFLGNDNAVYVRMIFRKSVGVPLAGNTVGGEWRLQFAKDGVTTTTTQRRLYGDDPEDGDDVVSGAAQPLDAVNSQSTTVTAPNGFVPLAGYDYGADQWRRFAKDGAVTVTRTLVDKGAAPDTGPLVISSRVEAMSDAAKNSAIKTTVTASELVPLVSYNFIDPRAKGAATITTETPVTSSATSGPTGFGVLESRIDALNPNQKVRTVTQVVDGFPSLIEYDRDPDERSLITITHQILASSTSPTPSLSPGTIEVIKPIDKHHSLRVTTVYDIPASREEQDHVSYPMPTLLRGFAWSSDCGTFVNARHGRTVMAEAKLLISYSTAEVVTAIPDLETNTYKYGGFSVNDVINDEEILVFDGKCTGSMTIPASNPSYTEYLTNWKGKYVPRSARSKPWKGTGLWRTEILKVKMK